MAPTQECPRYPSCLTLILALTFPNICEGLELPYAFGKDMKDTKYLHADILRLMSDLESPFVQLWR